EHSALVEVKHDHRSYGARAMDSLLARQGEERLVRGTARPSGRARERPAQTPGTTSQRGRVEVKQMRIVLAATAALLMVAFVGGLAWSITVSFQADRECRQRGFARGEALVSGAIFCSSGEIINPRR